MTTNESDFLNYLKTSDMEFTGKYDVPVVKGLKLKSLDSTDLIGFNYATNLRNIEENGNSMVHFFLPDNNIERVWNRPDDYIPVLNQYKAIIQPDFSQYVGMPRSMLIWQHYRRMWMARYYQNMGLKVIAAPCWSDEESFEYCFDGMPKNCCLCISSVGCVQNRQTNLRFMSGLKETIKRLIPSQVILYGTINDNIRAELNCPYIHIESDQKKRIRSWVSKSN